MQLRYLPTSGVGLRWLRNYYRKNPQLDRKSLSRSLKRAEETLLSFPQSGELFEDFPDVREYHINGTVFSLLYTLSDNTIMIIDVRDARGQRSAEALKKFMADVRLLSGL